jgi:hypothetical protein
LIPLRRSRPNCRECSDRKGFPGSVPKMEEMVGPVFTCRKELLRGSWQVIGLLASFMIFTVTVQHILDTTIYIP